jgi:hypothetical protein
VNLIFFPCLTFSLTFLLAANVRNNFGAKTCVSLVSNPWVQSFCNYYLFLQCYSCSPLPCRRFLSIAMDSLWDGWKVSFLTQAFSGQPAGGEMSASKESAGKTPYSSGYRASSFSEQTLVWEARTIYAQSADLLRFSSIIFTCSGT